MAAIKLLRETLVPRYGAAGHYLCAEVTRKPDIGLAGVHKGGASIAFRVGEVVELPDAELERFGREYRLHVREGDIAILSQEEVKALAKAAKAPKPEKAKPEKKLPPAPSDGPPKTDPTPNVEGAAS